MQVVGRIVVVEIGNWGKRIRCPDVDGLYNVMSVNVADRQK